MIEYLSLFVNILNNNKLLLGISMLLLNFGSRHVVADLGYFQEKFLASGIMKKIIVLSLFFVATRDIVISLCLTIIYIIIIDGLLHEKRKFCILPNKYKNSVDMISEKDYIEAQKKIEKYQNQKETTTVDNYDNYFNKISLLK